MTKLIVIGGATASGKTDFSIALASAINGEIISMDSMQIYKYMDIGTAKISLEQRQKVAHYMIDVCTPDISFTVSSYQKQALACIEDIVSRGKRPIFVGGTGLYLNSVLFPMSFSGNYDKDKREQLIKTSKERGKEYMHELLRSLDEEAAQRINVNDEKRVIRAIEKAQSGNKENDMLNPRFESIILTTSMERALIYERINLRVDKMFENGLVDEVKGLLKMGYTKSMTSMLAIGYKEVIAYLEGEISLDVCKELIKKNSRNYAKRQNTWFKRYDRTELDFLDLSNIEKVIALME